MRDVELPAADALDAGVVAVLPADAATVDLAEAPRILGGGAGLDGPARFEQLAELGAAIGASVGATRVITDRGWVGHDRQIGTTGVVVDPQLYLAFGISGAVQHTSGLGAPAHVISVNTDGHCPMMQLADLAITADANATLDELVALLAPAVIRAMDFDVIVVGGGPAGSCAAIVTARAGLRTLLVERGPFPGSKNMYGGVIYPRILDGLIPQLVGGGADPAVGHAPLDDDRRGQPGRHRRLPQRRAGASPRTTAPPRSARTSTTGSPATPRPPGRRCCAARPSSACCATAAGSSGCAPTGPTATCAPRS